MTASLLLGLLAAYIDESVTIRYDPRDLAEIRVYHRDTFLCRAVCQELAGETVGLKEVIQARNARKRELRKVIKERHAFFDRTFPKPHVSIPVPPEARPEDKGSSTSSLKHYECD